MRAGVGRRSSSTTPRARWRPRPSPWPSPEAVAAGHAVAVPVLPLSDTVKRVDVAGVVVGTPDRGGLRVLQTPQAFRAGVLGTDVLAKVLASHRAARAGVGRRG